MSVAWASEEELMSCIKRCVWQLKDHQYEQCQEFQHTLLKMNLKPLSAEGYPCHKFNHKLAETWALTMIKDNKILEQGVKKWI